MQPRISTMISTEQPAPSPRLIAAPFTPFNADGAINFEILAKYAQSLADSGVSGVFIGGTTGEGFSLSLDERMRLAEVWCEVAPALLRVIVHVGHTSLPESKRLAAHAQSVGARGIATIGSIFFEPSSPESWVATCQQIAAAAPVTPFYYYHMPSMSRIRWTASSLIPLLEKSIPTFRGVKFTHEDLEDYSKCLRIGGNRLEIFFGRDELLLEGLKLGATSAVGSTYNFAAPLYLKVARLHSEGNDEEAARCQHLCTRAIQIMVSFGGLSGIRSTMSLCGIDCGPMRLPLTPLTEAQEHELEGELREMGFFTQRENALAEILATAR